MSSFCHQMPGYQVLENVYRFLKSRKGNVTYTLSIDLRVVFNARDFFNSEGESPVIFLNCEERCATLLYPKRSAISLKFNSS
jgi:hypothetical protein